MISNTQSFLIVGCGHFGSKAAENLLEKNPRSKITVVDKQKKAIKKVSHLPIQTVICDGRLYLDQFLSECQPTDYIIPAVPSHLAFEFILSNLRPFGAKRRKVPLLTGLPNPILGKTGDLYTSLANFFCPEDCPEPSRYCTVTGKRRLKPLYQILKDLSGSFESRVIRSHQLGLGVGGFQAKVLLGLVKDLRKRRTIGRLTLISTACRCHGVTSVLSF